MTPLIRGCIQEYLRIEDNATNYTNPTIVIENEALKAKDVMKRKVIKDGYKIPALIGGYGFFATRKVPQYTVLNKYAGYMAIEKKWMENT